MVEECEMKMYQAVALFKILEYDLETESAPKVVYEEAEVSKVFGDSEYKEDIEEEIRLAKLI